MTGQGGTNQNSPFDRGQLAVTATLEVLFIYFILFFFYFFIYLFIYYLFYLVIVIININIDITKRKKRKKFQYNTNASISSSGAHPPFRATAGHLLTSSVPGVGHSQFYRSPGAGH